LEYLLNFTGIEWLALFLSALLMGFNKAGFEGLSLIAVILMAASFGSRYSTGLLLGIMVTADIPSAWHYRHDTNISLLSKLLPSAIIGISVGAIIGGLINEHVFKMLMGSLILLSSFLMLIFLNSTNKPLIKQNCILSVLFGVIAGFASMVGNAAGAIMILYLVSMNLNKNNLIGTVVWFFFILNLLKLPFHIFYWQTVNITTFLIAVILCPVTILSNFVAIRVIQILKEKHYKYFIIYSALLGGLYLVISTIIKI